MQSAGSSACRVTLAWVRDRACSNLTRPQPLTSPNPTRHDSLQAVEGEGAMVAAGKCCHTWPR